MKQAKTKINCTLCFKQIKNLYFDNVEVINSQNNQVMIYPVVCIPCCTALAKR